MRVLLIGANGQLGADLARVFSAAHQVIPANHDRIEVADRAGVEAVMEEARPDLVVNTAAFHQTDLCEEEGTRAFAVNALGAKNLAASCDARGAVLAHFSTDYVFDGEKGAPYAEEDCPRPLNLYGVSKLAGELAVRYRCPRHFIFRVSGLYGKAGSRAKGSNFVDMMAARAREGKELRVVDDQVLTPTYTLDVSRKVLEVVPSGRFGLYHLTSAGECSWFSFTAEILRQCGLEGVPLLPVKTGSFGEKARRPPYSVLDNRRLRREGFADLPDWKDALGRYLREKGHLAGPS